MADSFRWCDNVVQDFSTLKFIRKVSKVWLAKRRDSYYAVCGEDLFRWFSIKIYWLCDLNIRDQTQRQKPARTEPKNLIYYEALSTRWVRKGKKSWGRSPVLNPCCLILRYNNSLKKEFRFQTSSEFTRLLLTRSFKSQPTVSNKAKGNAWTLVWSNKDSPSSISASGF